MDPITTFLRLIEAIIKLVTVISEGQPPDVREQIWRWYVTDIKNIRKALNLPE
jgi:hypothetical protein